MWLKNTPKFDSQESEIVNLVEALLSTDKTIIEIDFTNATFGLYNESDGVSFFIDSVGVKVDVKQTEKVVALDQKMNEKNIDHIKNMISAEASKRRIEKHNKTFLNRIGLLSEISKNIRKDEKTV